MDPILKLAVQTIEKSKQAIIFTPSRASAEKTAEEIAKLTTMQLPELEQEILKAASTPTKQCRRLAHSIRKGIAFHHAGLLQKQKELIEEQFKTGHVKIICATPTLAAGLSLPVFRVIIKSLKRYSGRWGMDWIPVLEYLQMAGRAGRPEYEAFGESIVVAKSDAERDEIHERYICGDPEDIYSKLAVEPVLRTYLLSLISSGIIRNETSMKEFFAKTFWAHQFKDMDKLESIMQKMLSFLDEWEFITIHGKSTEDDFTPATEIHKPKETQKTMRATPLGKRISELYLDPLTANHLLQCLQNFNQNHTSFSLLQMISYTLEMRPLLRTKAKEQEYIEEELTKQYDLLLMEEPSSFDIDYPDFINSIKTTLFFEAWISEKNEDFLLEKFNIRPGEIRYKIENADWLLYACEELSKIMNKNELTRELHKLRTRVKHGVREELLALLKFKGIGRVRARKLFTQNIKNVGDIKKTDITSLTQIVGKAVAINLKKQVGEEVKRIKPTKRTGQLSIQKF